MELAQLEAFVQVAHHRSFSRAADTLYLTQPSVTARIQALERELGERLFERTGRNVTLTDAGRAFMPHAQRALTSVQEGTDAIGAVRHGEIGSIRIGASSTIGTYVLPVIMKRFRDMRPRIHVQLRTGGASEDAIEQLLSGEVHVAICRLNQHSDLWSTHLFNDDLTLVVPRDHPFGRRQEVSLSEAAGQPFLSFERGSSYHGLIYTMFLRAGVVPDPVMELDSIETTKHMVQGGIGIAILPVISVDHEVREGTLQRVGIKGMEQPAQREVGVHVLRNRVLAPPIREFLKVLGAHYGVDVAIEAPRGK